MLRNISNAWYEIRYRMKSVWYFITDTKYWIVEKIRVLFAKKSEPEPKKKSNVTVKVTAGKVVRTTKVIRKNKSNKKSKRKSK